MAAGAQATVQVVVRGITGDILLGPDAFDSGTAVKDLRESLKPVRESLWTQITLFAVTQELQDGDPLSGDSVELLCIFKRDLETTAKLEQNIEKFRFADLPKEALAGKDIVLAMVSKQGTALELVDESLKTDRDVALQAVRKAGAAPAVRASLAPGRSVGLRRGTGSKSESSAPPSAGAAG